MASSIRLLRRSGVTFKTRRQWGSRYPASANRYSLPGRYLFLHISVTYKSGSYADRMRTIEQIGASRFPNTRMSYNAVAFENGDIYAGQPLRHKGAHTINDKDVGDFPYDLNAYGEAICLPQMEADSVTDAQVDSIARWGAAKVLSGESNADRIMPHNMFAWKACPGAKADERLPEINRRFRNYVDNGLGKPKPKGPRINRARVNRALKHPDDKVGKTARKQLDVVVRALRDRGWSVEGYPAHLESVRRALSKFQENRGWKGEDADGLLGPTTAKLLGIRSRWFPLPAWDRK